MVLMTENWTEARLDELNQRVEAGFAEMRVETQRMETTLRAELRASSAELRAEMQAGFARTDARFDAMQRTIMQVGGGLIGTMILAAAALVATQL
jgi:F0F1-type ATP synthase membrane subunit b/b'